MKGPQIMQRRREADQWKSTGGWPDVKRVRSCDLLKQLHRNWSLLIINYEQRFQAIWIKTAVKYGHDV